MRYSLRALLLVMAVAPLLIAILYWRTPRRLSSEEQAAILDAVLRDVLTNPALQGDRDFYGTAGDSEVGLVWSKYSTVNWLDAYRPAIADYEFVEIKGGGYRSSSEPRLLGVALRRFDQSVPPSGATVSVVIQSAGGTRNGAGTIGGCHVYYRVKRLRHAWVVEYESSFDP